MKKTSQYWIVGTAVFVVVVASALGSWLYWRDGSGVDRFMQMDISGANNKDLEEQIRRMDLLRASAAQRRAVFEKLYARVKAMNIQEQLTFLNMGRKALKNKTDSQMHKNIKMLVIEFWGRQSRDYMQMTEEERKALIDKRIAQEKALEAAHKAKQLADKLMGKPGENAEARNARHAGEIVQAAAEALKSANSSDRAAAAQLYTDMQKRRAELGMSAGF